MKKNSSYTFIAEFIRKTQNRFHCLLDLKTTRIYTSTASTQSEIFIFEFYAKFKMTVEIDIHLISFVIICTCLLHGEVILKHVWTRCFKVNADCFFIDNDGHVTVAVNFRYIYFETLNIINLYEAFNVITLVSLQFKQILEFKVSN